MTRNKRKTTVSGQKWETNKVCDSQSENGFIYSLTLKI